MFSFLLCHVAVYFFFISFQVSKGLLWVRVNVPQYGMLDEIGTPLHCDYELGTDTLYSVKWYKDHQEFFRYVPKELPPLHSFQLDGLQVNLSKSNNRKVVLGALTLQSSGVYRCEVSAEAPSFASAQSEARMNVVFEFYSKYYHVTEAHFGSLYNYTINSNVCQVPGQVPYAFSRSTFPVMHEQFLAKEEPLITGSNVELQYAIGDEINLNCTSGKSYPASILHWYINDKQVINGEPAAIIRYRPVIHGDGLISSTFGLRLLLNSHHFIAGAMRVKCVVASSFVWHNNHHHHHHHYAPFIDNTNREALLLVKSSSSSHFRRKAPSIFSVLIIIKWALI